MLNSPFKHIDSPSPSDFSFSKAMHFKNLEYMNNSPCGNKALQTIYSPFRLLPQEKCASSHSVLDYKFFSNLSPLLHTPLHLKNCEPPKTPVAKQDKRKISSFESPTHEEETEDSAKKEKAVCESFSKQMKGLGQMLDQSQEMEVEEIDEEEKMKITEGFQVRKKLKTGRGSWKKAQEETKSKGKKQETVEKKHVELLESHFIYGVSKEIKETKDKLFKKQEKLIVALEPKYEFESESEEDGYLLESEEEISSYKEKSRKQDNIRLTLSGGASSSSFGNFKGEDLQLHFDYHFNKTKKNLVKILNSKRKNSIFALEEVSPCEKAKETQEFECNYCGKVFNKGRSLGGHVARVHKKEVKMMRN